MWLIPIIALFVFVAIILIKTLLFHPPKREIKEYEPIEVNLEKAVSDLAEMIRCRTVSHRNPQDDDKMEFERFENLLPKLFPLVYEKCSFEKVGERGLLLKWKGESAEAPSVFMSHYDVVNAEWEDWEKPPFDGVIENDVLWGRGTLDTKGNLNAILQSAEKLISEGFLPKNDIYFAFGGNEEVNGDGSRAISLLFKERGIKPGIVLDEGGAVCEGVFPGVVKPIALIGTGEKGQINIEYTVKGCGGHSSSPKANGPIIRLAKACMRVEKTPFKYTLSAPTKEFFDTAGRYSTFLYRMIFANQWCMKPVLAIFSRASGGEINAIVRTTTAFTQMRGSKGANVIPAVAKMVSNHRIIPGESVDSVIEQITKTVRDQSVKIRLIDGGGPSSLSKTDCEAFERVKQAVNETWDDVIVTPYLMLATSDSRHWSEISDMVYRFSPMELSAEERATIHGNNERIPISTIKKTVEFYTRIMKKS